MKILVVLITILAAWSATPAASQDREVPYWATLRVGEVNMRVGPSAEYKIDWVYRRQGMPVKVLRRLDGWRLIEDLDGTQGWVASRLLSPDRGVVILGDTPAAMREAGEGRAKLKWRLEPGVVGALDRCAEGWCNIAIGNREGWVRQNRLWGAEEP